MLSKNYLSVLSVIVVGSVMFTVSCKKNDDISNLSPTESVGDQSTPVLTESYTIVAGDGHSIGINGKRNETLARGVENTVNACGAASGLVVNAIGNVNLSGGRKGCVLSNTWMSGGGQVIALYINGQPYKDGNSGYGLWSAATNGIAAEYTQIEGGIIADKTFHNFVRTYCNSDTTDSPYFDSPMGNCTVPAGFDCGILNPKTKGKK